MTAAKPITKIIELALYGFHGFQSHNVRATFTPREPHWQDVDGDYLVSITESAARKFSCRCSDCTCGEGVPTEFECDEADFEIGEITLNGNYN